MPGVSPAPASAARSSSAGCGSASGSPTFSPTSCAAAASTSRLSGRSSLPFCTGCSCPAPTGPARSGWPTMPGSDGLQLHHFYRAMAWLGEETAPIADGELAPRCIKDVIEEQLFERRCDLFSELSVVFMD